MKNNILHTFHIPVMGLAYTIDSPVKVARFGISSVISIMEDALIEKMRKHYYEFINEPFRPITTEENDYRARRICDYLNLLNRIVKQQMVEMEREAFDNGTEIVKYFEMLPKLSYLRQQYDKMTATSDAKEKEKLQLFLRSNIRAGSIDVNIMTKTDKDNFRDGAAIENGSDAVAALRGYATSELSDSSVIFSAGMNPRLFNYLEKCAGFFDADPSGVFRKKIVIKVSDYRSALIQGKYLAKKGIWVSEFRIESGLNCGGHAFPTNGYLMGPILEEFKLKRTELKETLYELYIKSKNGNSTEIPPLRITVQGGIGTAAEDHLLRTYFKAEGTGWGTPFLLVPEATVVDDETLTLLTKAEKDDLILSNSSPLGVRFYYLKGTSAQKERLKRIEQGKPGSPCTEKHLAFNTEFTRKPLCTASYRYQKLKTRQLQSLDLPEEEYKRQLHQVHEKECLCVGLSNAASKKYEFPFTKKVHGVTICPGPNIINFSKIVSLQKMTDHIYGRTDIITNPFRQHMFITELNLYINFLEEKMSMTTLTYKEMDSLTAFIDTLRSGISYYKSMAAKWFREEDRFISDLLKSEEMLEHTANKYSIITALN